MARPIDWGDRRWYQRAVFYEVSVRGFADSNTDGTGRFNCECPWYTAEQADEVARRWEHSTPE